MDALRWVAPVALAVVLGAAAGAKLSSLGETRRSFEALGLPTPRVLAIAVPGLELTAAVLLVAAPPVGGALALALLAGFSAFLSHRLATGSQEPCACFGQARVRPIAREDIVRNVVLMALAVVTMVLPPG